MEGGCKGGEREGQGIDNDTQKKFREESRLASIPGGAYNEGDFTHWRSMECHRKVAPGPFVLPLRTADSLVPRRRCHMGHYN
jgi:hypothetical protein